MIWVQQTPGPRVGDPITPAERTRLERIARTTRGAVRIAALDRLADAAEADSEAAYEHDPIDEHLIETTTQAAIAAYRGLLAEPGLETYATVDEVLFRAGRMLARTGDAGARDAYALLVSKHGSSPLVAAAHVELGELELDRDPAGARRDFEDAIAIGHGTVVDAARLHHASALIALGDPRGALADYEQVAKFTQLRWVAAASAVDAYVRANLPAVDATAYFEQLDAEDLTSVLRRLALEYWRADRHDDQLVILHELIARAPDPETTCGALLDVFELSRDLGRWNEIMAAARAVTTAAMQDAPICRADTDDDLGHLAWDQQSRVPVHHALDLDELWQLELDVVTTPERRVVVLRDRALLLWTVAETVRRFDPAAWTDAAVAFEIANAATPDRDLELGAKIARDNAAALRR